mmetsp:Transcript_109561/g.353599  ORF Transcript_109561/g.353599 Transcript_109561/m.353599 type:complete len:466 (-) Transcript_109561:65-1462(-)
MPVEFGFVPAPEEESAEERHDGASNSKIVRNLTQRRRRLHYLDWLRAIMIFCITFAHVARSGMGNGVIGEIAVDDRTYIGAFGDREDERASALGVRYMSLLRQWCSPILFWVSGGAIGWIFPNWEQAAQRLVILTVIGMFLNTSLWYLGPADPICDPTSRCPGRGTLFDFTIVPGTGHIFPLIFQMWYMVALLCYLILNLPLFLTIHQRRLNVPLLAIQWAVTCGIYVSTVLCNPDLFPYRGLLLAELCVYEAVFIATAALTIPSLRPAWLPLRACHYLAGLTVVLMFACTPIANSVGTLQLDFGLYVFIGFNKFYALGYISTKDRNVEPLFSEVWPAMLLILTIVCPSTNFYLAGNLTYPYYPLMSDRFLYVAGSVVVSFVLDRMGRLMPSKPLPQLVGLASIILFMMHPWFMTLAIAAGYSSIAAVQATTVVLSALCAVPFCLLERAVAGRSESGDESSDTES